MIDNSYKDLIHKLDEFTRKYYLSKVVRGILYFISVALTIYLLFSFLEFRFYFSTTVRKILFYSLVAGVPALLYFWILNPLLKYYKLGKIIDHKTAAIIIGKHFADIQDKLLNILQLNEQSSNKDKLLIQASINQKISKITPLPFNLAVDFNSNKKYLKYALPPLAVFVFILFAAPNILKDSNIRLINNNTLYEKQSPFTFNIANHNMEVVQYENYELHVKITGQALPGVVEIQSKAAAYTMTKKSANEFVFTFNKVASDIDFQLSANGFTSQQYTIKVLPKPSILNFDVKLSYPNYTGKKNETLKNTGDLLIPEGTQVEWNFNTKNADKVELIFAANKFNAEEKRNGEFYIAKTIAADMLYKIDISNESIISPDTISYGIQVISDQYPQIQIQQYSDSTDDKFLYFIGDGSDDYGIKKIEFHYTIESETESENSSSKATIEKVPVSSLSTKANFTHNFDLHTANLKPGDKVSYYFEIWDNDGIHGSKSARSTTMQYTVPTKEQLEKLKDDINDDVKDKMNDVLDQIKSIQKETDKLQDKLLQKQDLSWEDKKSIENLMQKQQNMQQQVEQLKNDYKKDVSMQKEYLQPDPEILQKQEQLEKMFDDVLTPEMKKLMEQLQDLLEKLNKEQSMQQMEKMDMNNEQLSKEMDRMLELFKQMEMEQKMQETIDKLNDLAEKENTLSDENQDKKTDSKESLDKQQDIKDKFEDVKKDIDKLQEMNEQLEDKKELENTDDQQKQIDQEMQKSSDELQKNNKKQASDSQKKASESMKQMAEQMQKQMSQEQQQQQEEDMDALSQLLDNLIKLSVDQEALMNDVRQTNTTNPKWIDLMAQQQNIKENSSLVEDSLYALSKREFQISSFITREIAEVNKNMESSLEQMTARSTSQANLYQQSTMTGYNNLALMLDEVLQQMQQQMANKMPGSQMCQKPGGDSQLPTLGEMQKQLNKQINDLKGQMQDGQKQGNKEGMSQQLAELAAKQAAIRQAIEKMAQQLGGGNTEDGKLAKELQQMAQQMDQTEEDIVNKQISQEMLNRQQDILTRLLEAADADRQRKTDNERKADTAHEISRKLPPAIEAYLKMKNAQIDLYKTVPADLKPFYKNLVEDYFNSINIQ